MTQAEFITKIIGAEWVSRGVSFDACDCWGLVVLYYKHVLNIDLPKIEGYKNAYDVADCWQKEESSGHWSLVDKAESNDLVFTCYTIDGRPCHVGVYIGNGKVLHTDGSFDHGGSVRVNSAGALERLHGRMTYHKYTGV